MSVILPTRNGQERVEAAIRSVFEQTYRDLELVAVDDGSTDGTADLLRQLAREDSRLRVISLDASAGLQRALNRGLASAEGDLVGRIDDDDVWIAPEKLALQVERMEHEGALQVVGTGCEMFDPSTRTSFTRLQPTTDAEIRRTILSWNPFVHSSVVFRRQAALAGGGYDESFRHAEDYELWLRLGLRGSLLNLSEVCVRYRISSSVGAWPKRRRAWWEQVLLIRRYRTRYPGASRALTSSFARLCLHLLPVGQAGRTRLRGLRRR